MDSFALLGVTVVLPAENGIGRVEGSNNYVRWYPCGLELDLGLHGERGARATDVDALSLVGVAGVHVADDGVGRVERGSVSILSARIVLNRRLHGERGARATDVCALTGTVADGGVGRVEDHHRGLGSGRVEHDWRLHGERGARATDMHTFPLVGVPNVLVADDGVGRVEGSDIHVLCIPVLELDRRLSAERGA
eukprot:6900332-Prymnesium_polylepis.1